MPIVNIERKITKAPVRGEFYFVVDSSRKSHAVTFVNGKARLNLTAGKAAIVIGFTGSFGSKVTLSIQTPNKNHTRSVSIRRGNSVLTARYFDV